MQIITLIIIRIGTLTQVILEVMIAVAFIMIIGIQEVIKANINQIIIIIKIITIIIKDNIIIFMDNSLHLKYLNYPITSFQTMKTNKTTNQNIVERIVKIQ